MTITDVEFRLDVAGSHDALVNDPRGELVAILQHVIRKLERYDTAGTIRDSNGNLIGEWSIQIDEDDTP